MKNSLTFLSILVAMFMSLTVLGQEDRKNSIKALNDEVNFDTIDQVKIDRFDRWAYSDKKSDFFFYFAPMYQYGTGSPDNAYNLHHDLGVMHRWFLVDNDKLKLNFQGWLEQTSFWAGDTTSDFSKNTGMISSPNASSETGHDLTLENFFFEAFLFDEKWDITLGKFDPLFLTVFTNYSGWDKYNYFAKSAASDPVPDLDGGMGIYSEFHVSKKFSFGALVVDNEPLNSFLYIPDFSKTTWNTMGFIRFKLGQKKGLYSDHNLAFYHQSKTNEKEAGNGFLYTANQGLSDNLILVLKASHGTGRIDKLNGAYVAGLTFRNPANRKGDQAGFALMINEKGGKIEQGIDAYWRFYVNSYINVAPNFQAYYTVSDKINTVVGIRSFISY